MRWTLNEFADVLQVHPKIIWREVTGKDVKWERWKGINPYIDLYKVCGAFDVEPRVLRRCMKGKDFLLNGRQAAAFLGISYDWFIRRKKLVPAVFLNRQIVRWSAVSITKEAKQRQRWQKSNTSSKP